MDETKTPARRRTIPLPGFAVAALTARRAVPFISEQQVTFASSSSTLRDPDNFAGAGCSARNLGVPDVRTASVRRRRQ